MLIINNKYVYHLLTELQKTSENCKQSYSELVSQWDLAREQSMALILTI